ncbi:MAG: hypothetical protein U5L04_13245 [Trueperaceae bacterium]|nr:hypothetical protein [Trueperaceae bacterium]
MGDEAIGLALWFGFCFLVIVVILFAVRPWVLQRADQPGRAEPDQAEAGDAKNTVSESSSRDRPEGEGEASGAAQSEVEKGA